MGAPQDQLRIDVRQEPDRTVLSLHGELDMASAPLLQSKLESAEIEAAAIVVLDLQELQFIDSTGLRIVLAAHERLQEHGGELAVTRGSQQVQRLLAITGTEDHLRVITAPDASLV